MNIAIVLYGQPRNYMKGYTTIIQFIKLQHDCNFDFFYHSWVVNEKEMYTHSPWRNIDKKDISYNKNITTDLQKLYNPILYEIENQSNLTFDDSLYKNTIAFKNTHGQKLNNINNTLFQMYSRNKARNLLYRYLNKTNKVYDFVVTLRVDIRVMPEIQLNTLNKTNVYVSNVCFPRKIIPDNCIIAPTKIFLKWFTIYDMLPYILNNKQLQNNVTNLNENLEINAEELIFAKYILHYQNTNNILFFKG
jgi:hypothetical protein